jgi:adenine deaminase
MVTQAQLRRRIAQGQGREKADLVIAHARLLDLVTGALVETDIAITGGVITGTYGRYEGRARFDAKGRIAVPGFIDTHCHVESSLVTPYEFERMVLPRGTTTAVCDPHEMANVLGTRALDWFLACSERMVMDLFVNLSSCVPSTAPEMGLETSGARLTVTELLPYAQHPKVIGLAEMMNFPGVLAGDEECLAKIAAFAHRHLDGHAPLLRGLALNGYLAAGIRTEHEATSAEEALEKIQKGMTVLIREGSVCKDLAALAPLLTPETSGFLAFCTDDRNPAEAAEEGHIDHLVRGAIARGVAPLAAYRAATLSAAIAFGLKDRGMIAPSRRADILLLDDLEACRVAEVFSAGRRVEEALFAARAPMPEPARGRLNARPVTALDFVKRGAARQPVIGVIPGKIITAREEAVLPLRDGELLPDSAQDVARVAVVERHNATGNIGLGFVRGFGLARGAIAGSVGHDCHNICVVGADRADMAFAVNHLAAMGGGFAVVEGGRVLAELPLPIAGLMSERPWEEVAAAIAPMKAAARSLGVTLAEPFLQIAFLPLAVIPHLKITDRGVMDVDRMALVSG